MSEVASRNLTMNTHQWTLIRWSDDYHNEFDRQYLILIQARVMDTFSNSQKIAQYKFRKRTVTVQHHSFR